MPKTPRAKPQPLDAAAVAEQKKVLAAFGRTLRAERERMDLTLEEVAHAAGIHANYLGSVERGERNVALFNIWRIAAALNLGPASLVNALPKRKGHPAATA